MTAINSNCYMTINVLVTLLRSLLPGEFQQTEPQKSRPPQRFGTPAVLLCHVHGSVGTHGIYCALDMDISLRMFLYQST
jgi:hypothetical protein